jgi:hypothetical protein
MNNLRWWKPAGGKLLQFQRSLGFSGARPWLHISDRSGLYPRANRVPGHAAYAANPAVRMLHLCRSAGGQLVPSPASALGLRTVDRRDNSLLPGQKSGEADAVSRTARYEKTGPQKRAGNFLPPGSPAVPTSYTPSNTTRARWYSVEPRTISI